MTKKFELIKLVSIDQCGANYEIAGTWHGKSYHIEINCEYDGRDVDSSVMVEDSYNPMWDTDHEDFFFQELCEEERFNKLHNAGYKCWELFPSDE
jgi:hypothetical protein